MYLNNVLYSAGGLPVENYDGLEETERLADKKCRKLDSGASTKNKNRTLNKGFMNS